MQISIQKNPSILNVAPPLEAPHTIADVLNDAIDAFGADLVIDKEALLQASISNTYLDMPEHEILHTLQMGARALIEQDPAYDQLCVRLSLETFSLEIFGVSTLVDNYDALYRQKFIELLEHGIQNQRIEPQLRKFDWSLLAEHLQCQRDQNFKYLGIQTLYDRYFLQVNHTRIEMPQSFFMRVAMGLALNEIDFNAKAIEFYELLSSFYFMSATPTLFNSATLHPQLSSCYLTQVDDSLEGIFEAYRDNALLSKFAGGLGNSWSHVRALGSVIKGTAGQSQGIVPFLKINNDVALAVNQGGKRKGAICAYLETWHADIEEFLDLRKNTGDERRRTPDMHTANWIPDLFMQRVEQDALWSLFSPDECPLLSTQYGNQFNLAYQQYEQQGLAGKLNVFKQIPAKQLWRKMLTQLFETGHPWINFKDACNIRSPQQHCGTIHSSNLCTEITLNTSSDEIAVCNLGSIRLDKHLVKNDLGDYELDKVLLQKTIRTATRMLDNVIDLNYYPVEAARRANLRHRPIGLGLMGLQDALYRMSLPFSSAKALDFTDESMEFIAYCAYESSMLLAQERGAYSSFAGSLWSKGVLPFDSLSHLETSRSMALSLNKSKQLDWDGLRQNIQTFGMRNSNVLAIAPTATISNIVGCTPSIEPSYQNLYVKSNLSGEFTVIQAQLVDDLKRLNLWSLALLNQLKQNNGSLLNIEGIPEHLKQIYATAFEISPMVLIEAAARRQKWIDQSQSLNLYLDKPSGKLLNDVYMSAWKSGLKTTYYLRTRAASQAEKSTSEQYLTSVNHINTDLNKQLLQASNPIVCNLDSSECEVCQ